MGYCLYSQPKCPSVKRPYPPGPRSNARRKKKSPFGEQLQEKQKLRLTYGMMEKQFYRTYEKAAILKGNRSDNFLVLLESRLMSLVFRMGIARSIFDARQLVCHGHVQVDGHRVDIPGYWVKPGEVIGLSEKARKMERVEYAVQNRISSAGSVPYLEIQEDGISARFTGIADITQVPVTRVNVPKIIEFYSR